MVLPVMALLYFQALPETRFTLEAALQHGLTARGRVEEARAVLAEARGAVRLAGQVPNPNGTYTHSGDAPRQHIQVDQPLAWIVTRGLDRAVATAGLRRAAADSVVLVASIAREIRIAYFGALGSRVTLQLMEAQVAAADSLRRFALLRYQTGDISQYEYRQAALEAHRSVQLLSNVREDARAAAAEFVRAIGWVAPGTPVPEGTLDQGLDLPITDAAPPDSLPGVRWAGADSSAQWLVARRAQRARIPVPSLTVGSNWDDPSQRSSRFAVVGLSLPLPLWNTSAAEATMAAARARQAGALAGEVRLEAMRAIVTARARLEESARRARFARDSLVPAVRALRSQALAGYRAGETSVLHVLDAFRSEREIVLAEIQDFTTFQAALAAWHALFGRVG